MIGKSISLVARLPRNGQSLSYLQSGPDRARERHSHAGSLVLEACTLAIDSGRLMADTDFTGAALLRSSIGGMEATGHEEETMFAKKAQ
jgi:hypothetical protein